jgi:hypothetical protein
MIEVLSPRGDWFAASIGLSRGGEMPTPINEQRLILCLGMLLFLLSCAYVQWEHRYYLVVGVNKTDAEPYRVSGGPVK